MKRIRTSVFMFVCAMALAGTISLYAQQTKAKSNVIHGPDFERSSVGKAFTDKRRCFGLAVVDINNDMFPDLFFNNMTTPCDLYINDAGKEFQKHDTSSLVKNIGWATGQAWADYDNDGFIDFLLAFQDHGGNKLYHNNGKGGFERIAAEYVTTDKANSFHPAWADINNDGYVDLLVANCTYFGNKKETRFFMYVNDQHGGFQPFTDDVLSKLTVSSSSSNFCDYDGDGDADLLVTTWGKGAFILKNEGKGVFKRLTDLEGADGNLITCTWVDFDTDGDFDIFITRGHPNDTTNLLYRNDGNDRFTRVISSVIITPMGKFWNAGWGDFDNDGDLDLCYTDLVKKNYLFENDGNGNFAPNTGNIIVTDTSSKNACAMVWTDYNNNGQLDLILANILTGQSPIFQNKGNINHWLKIKCEGTVSNRSGIGAVVKIKATIEGKAVWQVRQVASVEAFRTTNLTLHFGLGDAAKIDEMVVTWPSGITQTMKNVKGDEFMVLREGRSVN